MMPRNDLAQIRTVTDNLFFWQGLRFVPLGGALVLVSLVYSVPAAKSMQSFVALGGMALALLASGAIGRYYRSSLGDVQGIPGAHLRRSRIKWWVVYPMMVLSFVVDLLWPQPFFVTGIVWAAAIIAYWRSTGGGRQHYVPIAALLALSSLLP